MAHVTAPREVGSVAVDGDGDLAASVPAGRRGGRRRALILLAVTVVVLGMALAGYLLTRPDGPAPVTQHQVDLTVQRGLEEHAEAEARAPADGTIAHAAIQPSLVLVRARGGAVDDGMQGTGAGVIVNVDGTVLTALHVVEGAAAIEVAFADGTRSPARVGVRQPENDIVTLLPEKLPETVVPAVLGGGVRVGTPVFAVGHPLGLADSLSAGVVSALDRTVRVDDGRELKGLIQVDAAVNPGNSGGPLLNASGHVVGIVTSLANPGDEATFIGIGFAVPIATAGGAGASPPR